MNILLVKTSSLGDVVHNLPIIDDILHFFTNIDKNINIDWCVEQSFADIVRLHPQVRNIWEVNLRKWKKNIFSLNTWKEFFLFKKQLQSVKYDYIIDTQGLIKSAFLSKMSNLNTNGKKYSFDKYCIKERFAANFYHKNYFIDKNLHAVNRNRLLVANVFDYKNNENFQKSLNFPNYGIKNFVTNIKNNLIWLKNANNCNLPLITFLTATSRDDKLWAEQNWITLGQKLQQLGYFIVFPAGSVKERQRAEIIAKNINNSIVAPPLDLQTLAVLLNSSVATIGVDTGLTHLSVALEIPTIAIYTATNPSLTGVFGRGVHKNIGGINQNPTTETILSIFNEIM